MIANWARRNAPHWLSPSYLNHTLTTLPDLISKGSTRGEWYSCLLQYNKHKALWNIVSLTPPRSPNPTPVCVTFYCCSYTSIARQSARITTSFDDITILIFVVFLRVEVFYFLRLIYKTRKNCFFSDRTIVTAIKLCKMEDFSLVTRRPRGQR